MKLDRILPYARLLLEKTVHAGDIAIDCTMGNGHDTLYLAKLVGSDGHVVTFWWYFTGKKFCKVS